MQRLKAGKGFLGCEGVFPPLIKSFLEEALEGELEAHIVEKDLPNYFGHTDPPILVLNDPPYPGISKGLSGE